jgi:hypothetical protein
VVLFSAAHVWNDRSYVTNVCTPGSKVLLEKLTSFQLVKKFPAFYGTQRFITTFTNAHHLSLSWASLIQTIPPHSTFWRSILILSSHLRLGLTDSLESFLMSPVQTGKSYLFAPNFQISVWQIPIFDIPDDILVYNSN